MNSFDKLFSVAQRQILIPPLYSTKCPVLRFGNIGPDSHLFSLHIGNAAPAIWPVFPAAYGLLLEPSTPFLRRGAPASAANLVYRNFQFMAEVIEINNVEDLSQYRLA